MKRIIKSSFLLLIVAALIVSLSGCAEGRYYRKNHYHTRGWYNRRHQTPPPNAHFDVEIRH